MKKNDSFVYERDYALKHTISKDISLYIKDK